jgi:hypothetical protein
VVTSLSKLRSMIILRIRTSVTNASLLANESPS